MRHWWIYAWGHGHVTAHWLGFSESVPTWAFWLGASLAGMGFVGLAGVVVACAALDRRGRRA